MAQKTPPRRAELGITPAFTAISAAMRWPIEARTKTLLRAQLHTAQTTQP